MKIVLACLFCFGNIMAQVPSYVPTNGLVGWWGFNGNANDASSSGNHGTVYGAVLANDRNGKINSSYSFNGNQHILIPHRDNMNSDFITISLWFKSNSISNSSLIYKTSLNAKNEVYGCVFNYPSIGNNVWSVKNGNNCNNPGAGWQTTNTTGNFFDGNWHNIVCTYDGKYSRVYIDNSLISSDTFQTSVMDRCAGDINIGKGWNSNYHMIGSIDDLGIWNRVLTSKEIENIFHTKTPMNLTSKVISNVTCFQGNDGSATVEVNGGMPPYIYEWNSIPKQTTQTASNLVAGEYIVTVTDSIGVTEKIKLDITQPNEIPAPTITGEQSICLSSTPSTFTVNQIPGYSIEWEKPRLGSIVSYKLNAVSIIWNASGTDSVRVKIKDNVSGCERDTILRVVILTSPEPLITGDARACENQSPRVYRVQKQSGRTYSWNKPKNGIIVGSTTSDSISVQWVNSGSDTLRMEERDNATNCTKDTSFIVSIAPLPDATISGANQVRENEQGITYSVKNESGLNYDWSIASGDATIAGKTGNSVTLNAGKPGTVILNVKITNQNGCMSESELAITVKSLTNIRESSSAPFTLYPNPAGDYLYVKMDEDITGDIYIELYDILGNRHFKQTYQSTEIIRIPVQELSQGMYMIKVKTLQGEYMERFVK